MAPAPLVVTPLMVRLVLPLLVIANVLVSALPHESEPKSVPFAELAASPLAIAAPLVPKIVMDGRVTVTEALKMAILFQVLSPELPKFLNLMFTVSPAVAFETVTWKRRY